MKFIPFNANYFNSQAEKDYGDCVVRALCVTLQMGYKKICELLGVDFKLGTGYGYAESDGITPDEVESKLSEYVIRIYKDDEFYNQGNVDFSAPLEDELLSNWADIENGGGMGIIADEAKLRGKRFYPNRFLVFTRNPKSKNSSSSDLNLHATAIIRSKGEWSVVDGSKIRGIMNQVPTDLFAIKKFCKPDDPDYYYTEKNKVLKQGTAEFLKYRTAKK